MQRCLSCNYCYEEGTFCDDNGAALQVTIVVWYRCVIKILTIKFISFQILVVVLLYMTKCKVVRNKTLKRSLSSLILLQNPDKGVSLSDDNSTIPLSSDINANSSVRLLS